MVMWYVYPASLLLTSTSSDTSFSHYTVGPSSASSCQSSEKYMTDELMPEAKLVKCASRNMGAKETVVYSMQLQSCQDGQSDKTATARAVQVLAANQCPTPLIKCTRSGVQLGC